MTSTIQFRASGRTLVARTYAPTGPMGKLLQRAADLQGRIQLLEAELKEHRTEILDHMQDKGLDRLEVGDFRATRKTRNSWEYTPETDREMLRLAQMQKWEQSQGLATNNPTIHVALTTISAAKP